MRFANDMYDQNAAVQDLMLKYMLMIEYYVCSRPHLSDRFQYELHEGRLPQIWKTWKKLILSARPIGWCTYRWVKRPYAAEEKVELISQKKKKNDAEWSNVVRPTNVCISDVWKGVCAKWHEFRTFYFIPNVSLIMDSPVSEFTRVYAKKVATQQCWRYSFLDSRCLDCLFQITGACSQTTVLTCATKWYQNRRGLGKNKQYCSSSPSAASVSVAGYYSNSSTRGLTCIMQRTAETYAMHRPRYVREKGSKDAKTAVRWRSKEN